MAWARRSMYATGCERVDGVCFNHADEVSVVVYVGATPRVYHLYLYQGRPRADMAWGNRIICVVSRVWLGGVCWGNTDNKPHLHHACVTTNRLWLQHCPLQHAPHRVTCVSNPRKIVGLVPRCQISEEPTTTSVT